MIKSYAAKNYERMFHQPEGQLKHPFIVPGSVYANQLWDWDCLIQRIGSNSCGPALSGKYRLEEKDIRFAFSVKPAGDVR